MGTFSDSRNTFGRGLSLEFERQNSWVNRKKYKHHKHKTNLQRWEKPLCMTIDDPLLEMFRNQISSLSAKLGINKNFLLDVVQSKKNDRATHGFLTRNTMISSRKIHEKFRCHNHRFSHYLARTELLHWIPHTI